MSPFLFLALNQNGGGVSVQGACRIVGSIANSGIATISGQLTMVGDFQLTAASQMVFQAAGSAAGGYGQITMENGNVVLRGSVRFSPWAGFDPQEQSSFS